MGSEMCIRDRLYTLVFLLFSAMAFSQGMGPCTSPADPCADFAVTSNLEPTCGGTIEVTATGGGGGYQYVWSSGQPASDEGNGCFCLNPGNYSVTISSANGCSQEIGGTIVDPSGDVCVSTCDDMTACNFGDAGDCVFANEDDCLDCNNESTCQPGTTCDGVGNCVPQFCWVITDTGWNCGDGGGDCEFTPCGSEMWHTATISYVDDDGNNCDVVIQHTNNFSFNNCQTSGNIWGNIGNISNPPAQITNISIECDTQLCGDGTGDPRCPNGCDGPDGSCNPNCN